MQCDAIELLRNVLENVVQQVVFITEQGPKNIEAKGRLNISTLSSKSVDTGWISNKTHQTLFANSVLLHRHFVFYS